MRTPLMLIAAASVATALSAPAVIDRADAHATHTSTQTSHTTAHRVTQPAGHRKTKRTAAPTTVDGYRAMFAKVPVSQWGGADVSISTKLRDGRRVWLYGDTLSGNNGFVHSTALTQSGGTLHVSAGGKQVLPNAKDANGRTIIFWVEQAKQQASGDLLITAAPVTLTGTGLFDFHRDPTRSRQALVAINSAGDLTFKKWVRYIHRPLLTIDGEDAHPAPDGKVGHWYYSYVIHDIRLADGTWLETNAQNWEDGFSDAHRNPDGSLRYTDWRPVFSSSTSRSTGITPNPNLL